MIEIKKLSAAYGKNLVLQDVSFCLEKGSLCSVIGVNGCGKSTLLKAMLKLLPAAGGEIIIDAQPLQDMSRIDIARKMAYLAQGRNTPDMTVEQLVLHGRFPHLSYPRRYSKRDRELALEAMEQTGMAVHASKSLHSLSGGMRQKAYIAMALAQGSEYVLMDEPTTYLDIAHQLELMKRLRALAEEGRGIIAVMHDLPLALSFSDIVLVLDEGRIKAFGTPDEVLEQGAVERVFGVALQRSPDGQGYSYKY